MNRRVPSGGALGDPAVRLAQELRSLKSVSGLTYTGISERTHYAKSSWERWVNGKQFPPRDAVERIAAVCEGDARHLLELWTLAATCGPAAGGAEEAADAGNAAAGSRERRRTALWSLASFALVLAGGLAVVAADRWELWPGLRPGPDRRPLPVTGS